ncbi:MAG: HDIG domain-containing protein [Vicingaceae bacterium]
MKRLFDLIRDHHNSIFKVSLFLIAIGLIVYLFPREGKFKYEFQKGKPWQHEDLIAPFNFPIYKTDKQLDEEKELIKQNQKVYFFRNGNIKKQALERVENQFHEKFIPLTKALTKKERIDLKEPSYYLKRGLNFLTTIYDSGIIELHSSIEGKPKEYEIAILENNVASSKTLNEVYTIKEAYQALKKSTEDLSSTEQKLMVELLEDGLRRNLRYDKETNDYILEEELSEISPTVGMIQEGERVVAKGELLNNERFKVVESLKIEYESQLGETSQFSLILLGQVILVTLMILSLAMFLVTFRPEIIRSDTKIIFLLLLIVLFVFASKMAIDIDNINLYLVPFCILPLVIRTFFDIRAALFTFLVAVLVVGFIAPNPYEFIIIQMIAGIITLFSIISLRNRSQLFLSSLIVFLIYSFVYIGIGLIQEGSFESTNWKFLGWFFGSAMLTLFTYPLIYIFEKIFGFVSDVTLMELADTNSKLLRKLNLKAPGTFQHSLQVSNLAEEAIREIGGNALLIRTGALYHDIGKMNTPNYFIENQNSDYNPHEELAPEESASIIIDHVIRGIEMARRYKLPDIIIDFIRTHHGTTKTLYFYKKYIEENPEEDLDTSIFQYPGPIPYSKETAVLMMADSVEAASRSLPKYDRESIEKLVNGIIDSQIKDGQFAVANITFKDINTIKKMFKKKLMSIYHVRVEYPE